jgi:hypothetical protein
MGSYPLMVFAHVLYGLGFEPMYQAKNFVMASWFLRSELSFANNLSLAVCRTFCFFNGLITPRIAEN